MQAPSGPARRFAALAKTTPHVALRATAFAFGKREKTVLHAALRAGPEAFGLRHLRPFGPKAFQALKGLKQAH